MRNVLLSLMMPILATGLLLGCEAEKQELMENMEKEKGAAMEKMEMSKADWKKKVKESCPRKKFKDKKARKKCITALKNES